jgi:competence protein ComFC
MNFLAYFLNYGKCYVCEKEGDILCEKCFSRLDFINKQEFVFDTVLHSLYSYNEMASKILIMSKYPPYYFYILRYLIQNTVLPKFENSTLFCPIPLSSLKMFERKFNQAEIISEEFARKQKLPVTSLLNRTKETKALFDLRRKQRIFEMENSFKVSFFGLILPKKETLKVILVDDLVTTGSTISQAIKVLRKAGYPNIQVLTLFRA